MEGEQAKGVEGRGWWINDVKWRWFLTLRRLTFSMRVNLKFQVGPSNLKCHSNITNKSFPPPNLRQAFSIFHPRLLILQPKNRLAEVYSVSTSRKLHEEAENVNKCLRYSSRLLYNWWWMRFLATQMIFDFQAIYFYVRHQVTLSKLVRVFFVPDHLHIT